MPDHFSKLLLNILKEKPWQTKPIFCFTVDIDWASEIVLKLFFDEKNLLRIGYYIAQCCSQQRLNSML